MTSLRTQVRTVATISSARSASVAMRATSTRRRLRGDDTSVRTCTVLRGEEGAPPSLRSGFRPPLLAAFLVAAPMPWPRTPTCPSPARESFGGAAEASAARRGPAHPALLPVPGLFDFGLVEGRGTYESSNQEGRASLALPRQRRDQRRRRCCAARSSGRPSRPRARPLFGPILAGLRAVQVPADGVRRLARTPTTPPTVPLTLGEPATRISLDAVGCQRPRRPTTAPAPRPRPPTCGCSACPPSAPSPRCSTLLGLAPLDDSLLSWSTASRPAPTRRSSAGRLVGRRPTPRSAGCACSAGSCGSAASDRARTSLTGGDGGAGGEPPSLEVAGVDRGRDRRPRSPTTAWWWATRPRATGPLVQQLARAVGVRRSQGARLPDRRRST